MLLRQRVQDGGVLMLLTTILAAWWVRHRLVSREGRPTN
jgi:hypothetical protein